MTFEELVLYNFGLYEGCQHISLACEDDGKPVILFGGMNGGGKTTILDAIQLGLYGKLARSSNRGNLSYHEYLLGCIHQSVPRQQEASVEVAFRHLRGSTERHYRVKRLWRTTGKTVAETLEVEIDGEVDTQWTEAWLEHINEVLPVRLSHLFFFDGEKIEAFADPISSAKLLSTGVHSLLGLDLVDQLSTDLIALERRNRKQNATTSTRIEVDSHEAQLVTLRTNREKLVDEISKLHVNKVELRRRQQILDSRFRTEGGDLYTRRKELERQRADQLEAIRIEEARMLALAHGPAPLLLAQVLLEQTYQHAQREKKAREAEVLARFLESRDRRLAKKLKRLNLAKDAREAIGDFLATDRRVQEEAQTVPQYLKLGDEQLAGLNRLAGTEGTSLRIKTEEHLRQCAGLRQSLDGLDRLLADVPDEEAIRDLMNERAGLQAEFDDLDRRLTISEEELRRFDREIEDQQRRLNTSLERIAEKEFDQEAMGQRVHHARRVRDTLGLFRDKVLNRHVRRIEALILESFQRLLHKETLVSNLSIDPRTFATTLTDESGQVVSPRQLSAGERQLLAVSMLWGLAKASGRQLPVVIDTPMGRLDPSHRLNLLQKYFPEASHQVILLSTDEEIDRDSYALLHPHLGMTYRLKYNDQRRATRVHTGYFWGASE